MKKTDALVVAKALEKEARPFMKKVSTLSIKTQEDFNLAGTLLKEVKIKASQAKEREESLTRPLTKVVADIKTLFRPFRDSVRELEEDTKEKMLMFVASNERKQNDLLIAFKEGKVKNTEMVISKSNALEVENGAAQVKRIWTAVCIDETKTPREFLTPDESKIKEALKAGKKVRGWSWEQVKSIAV